MGLSAQHILLLLVIALLLFGRGKISELMGDVAKGIKSFKKGMADDDGCRRSSDAAAHARQRAGADERPQQDRLRQLRAACRLARLASNARTREIRARCLKSAGANC